MFENEKNFSFFFLFSLSRVPFATVEEIQVETRARAFPVAIDQFMAVLRNDAFLVT